MLCCRCLTVQVQETKERINDIDGGSEQFEHLANAPIVEAVIHLRARAEIKRTDEELKELLIDSLPQYPTVKSMDSVEFRFEVQPRVPEGVQGERAQSERAWLGYRVENKDGTQIAQFTRDFFAFSRLRPYEDWGRFQSEAIRLWLVHLNLLGPTDIQRMGVRFINRFEVPGRSLDPGAYLQSIPSPPAGFDRSGFLYRDTLLPPEQPYCVTRIQTIQPAKTDLPDYVALLLDNDVYSTKPFPSDVEQIEAHLAEMHDLKNQVFFESVTEQALDLCR